MFVFSLTQYNNEWLARTLLRYPVFSCAGFIPDTAAAPWLVYLLV
jgi:hypothetical protein